LAVEMKLIFEGGGARMRVEEDYKYVLSDKKLKEVLVVEE